MRVRGGQQAVLSWRGPRSDCPREDAPWGDTWIRSSVVNSALLSEALGSRAALLALLWSQRGRARRSSQDDEYDDAEVRPHRVKQQAPSEERSKKVKVSHVAKRVAPAQRARPPLDGKCAVQLHEPIARSARAAGPLLRASRIALCTGCVAARVAVRRHGAIGPAAARHPARARRAQSGVLLWT